MISPPPLWNTANSLIWNHLCVYELLAAGDCSNIGLFFFFICFQLMQSSNRLKLSVGYFARSIVIPPPPSPFRLLSLYFQGAQSAGLQYRIMWTKSVLSCTDQKILYYCKNMLFVSVCSTLSVHIQVPHSYLFTSLANIPSSFMMLIGIMVNLSSRERVYRGRGQGNIGPVGPIGFTGFGASLGLLFLSSLSTYTRKRKGCV